MDELEQLKMDEFEQLRTEWDSTKQAFRYKHDVGSREGDFTGINDSLESSPKAVEATTTSDRTNANVFTTDLSLTYTQEAEQTTFASVDQGRMAFEFETMSDEIEEP